MTYRGAKVAINFDHFDRPGFFSDRYLRAMACGVVVVECTGYTPDEVVRSCNAWIQGPGLKEVGNQDADYVYTNDRWHSRVKELEQWVDTARTERNK
jgi:hypothetical protein